jgi:hypothetical protein
LTWTVSLLPYEGRMGADWENRRRRFLLGIEIQCSNGVMICEQVLDDAVLSIRQKVPMLIMHEAIPILCLASFGTCPETF